MVGLAEQARALTSRCRMMPEYRKPRLARMPPSIRSKPENLSRSNSVVASKTMLCASSFGKTSSVALVVACENLCHRLQDMGRSWSLRTGSASAAQARLLPSCDRLRHVTPPHPEELNCLEGRQMSRPAQSEQGRDRKTARRNKRRFHSASAVTRPDVPSTPGNRCGSGSGIAFKTRNALCRSREAQLAAQRPDAGHTRNSRAAAAPRAGADPAPVTQSLLIPAD